jgi:hypothetical protein
MSTIRQPPARFAHARAVIAMMVEDAGENTIWKGKLTELIMERCNLSVPEFTKVRRLLVACDAIRQVKRGGGGQPSEWRILKRELTDDELWFGQAQIAKEDDMPEPIQQRQNDLNRRVSDLEQQMGEVLAVLRGSEALS